MPRMTGGEAVVQTLVAEGVEAVFGLPGTHALAMFDALQDAPSIRRITTRHEQGATFMADGYARASGDIGVCLLSTGPAAANSITAMSTAYADSSPVLNISSQLITADVGDGRAYLHDVSDQLGAFAHVTGWSARAKSVTAIPWLVHEAVSNMRTGRPGPAALEVPKDVLDATGDATVLPRSPRVVPSPDPGQIVEASDMLLRARRPVIWAGGGAAQASEQIARLADSLEAPSSPPPPEKVRSPKHTHLHSGPSQPSTRPSGTTSPAAIWRSWSARSSAQTIPRDASSRSPRTSST